MKTFPVWNWILPKLTQEKSLILKSTDGIFFFSPHERLVTFYQLEDLQLTVNAPWCSRAVFPPAGSLSPSSGISSSCCFDMHDTSTVLFSASFKDINRLGKLVGVILSSSEVGEKTKRRGGAHGIIQAMGCLLCSITLYQNVKALFVGFYMQTGKHPGPVIN